MSSALIQASLSNSTAIMIALVVLVLAIGLMVFLFARSSAQRRERDAHVRARMVEMEREAQFEAAADHVQMSKDPGDIALQIAGLLQEYMSMRLLAVYAGHASDSGLSNLLSQSDLQEVGASDSRLPDLVSASLLADNPRPAVVGIAAIADHSSSPASVAEEPQPEKIEQTWFDKTEEAPSDAATEESEIEQRESRDEGRVIDDPVEVTPALTQSASQEPVARSAQSVMLLPWRGPFDWGGLLVIAAHSGIASDSLEPYRRPLERLTDRLAIALDCQRSDALSEEVRESALRTTDFSRSLFSYLDGAAPLDAIVRQLTRLVSSDSAAMWRVEEASGMVRMVAAHGLKSQEFLPLPVGQGLAGSVAQTGEVLALEDAPADPRCIFPREARESGIISYLGAPLSADGKTLGVIEVHRPSRRSWTQGDLRSLQSGAAILAELIRSTDSRVNRVRVESAYLGLSESLQQLRSEEEVKAAVVEVLGHALAASRVIVVEFNDQDQPEPVKHEYRQASATSALGAVVGTGLTAGEALSLSGQPIAFADAQKKSLAGAETAGELGVLSEIAAPIRVDDKTRGIVYVHQCDRVREWEPDELEFAERVVRQLSLSLWNLRSLKAASSDAQQARAEAQRAVEISSAAPGRIRELEQKLASMERVLGQSRSAEDEAQAMLAKASELEAKARAEADASHRVETEVKQQLERLQEEHKQAQGSAQQLLEINRLKSEFIVNAGHEMEASLQSVLGLAELLERGSYGTLTTEQHEAVRGIYGWARRIKGDIDWLVEYGSARSRRLEPSSEN